MHRPRAEFSRCQRSREHPPKVLACIIANRKNLLADGDVRCEVVHELLEP